MIIVLELLALMDCGLPGFDKVSMYNFHLHPNLHGSTYDNKSYFV